MVAQSFPNIQSYSANSDLGAVVRDEVAAGPEADDMRVDWDLWNDYYANVLNVRVYKSPSWGARMVQIIAGRVE